jgi:hypothetical protein
MSSTQNPQLAEQDKVLVARADERLAHAYEQIARADEQLARVTERLSGLDRNAERQPLAGMARPESRGWPVLRGLVGLVLAAGIAVAAFLSQSSYGETVKASVAQWAPRLGLSAMLPREKPGLAGQPDPSGIQLAAADPASAQPAGSVQAASQGGAQAGGAPDLAQVLQAMAADLASLKQAIEQVRAGQEQIASNNANAIEQLKAGQERLASDNANAAAQLKASQEQIAALLAKASEPKAPAPSAQPGRRVSSVAPAPPVQLRPQTPKPADAPRR